MEESSETPAPDPLSPDFTKPAGVGRFADMLFAAMVVALTVANLGAVFALEPMWLKNAQGASGVVPLLAATWPWVQVVAIVVCGPLLWGVGYALRAKAPWLRYLPGLLMLGFLLLLTYGFVGSLTGVPPATPTTY
jgi:hypothetical protein